MANILIVEDEPIISSSLKYALERLGYHVVGQIQTGEEVMSALQKHAPDLILMDISLNGEMDGVEAAQQLQENVESPPVIFLTGHDDQRTIERATSLGPYGYILKPFNKRELQICMETTLYRSSMEKKLRHNELKFRTIVKSIGQPIVLFDRGKFITFSNFLFNRLVGVDGTDQLEGKPAKEVFELFDHGNSYRDYLQECQERGIVIELKENTILHALLNDSKKDITGSVISPMIDDSGSCLGYIMAIKFREH